MEEKETSALFDVISDIEGATAPLEEIVATLTLFEEQLHSTVKWLDPVQPYTVDLFVRRFRLLAAMLSMLLRNLEQRKKEIQDSINKAYRLYAEIKALAAGE